MTLRTLLGNSGKSNLSTFCLIRWPEEESHSVVPITRILSPPQEIAIGAMCKVKGFEKFISEIVALGTKEELNKQLDAMEGSGESSGASGKENVIDQPTRKRKVAKNNEAAEGNPPTKKQKITGKGRQKKVDKTPTRKKATTKTPGQILLVTAGPSSTTSSPSPSPKAPSVPPKPPKQQAATPNLPPSPEAPPLPPKPPKQHAATPNLPQTSEAPLLHPPKSAERQATALSTLPPPDLEWYESSPLPPPASNKTKHPPRIRTLSGLSSSSSESEENLALHLTVDEHDTRLQTLEAGFSRLETTVNVMMENLARLEKLFQQQSRPASTMPVPSSGRLPLPSVNMSSTMPGPSSGQLPLPSINMSSAMPGPSSGHGRLPSSAIDKSKLQPPSLIINNNAHLVGKEGKVGSLALLLARESFFGEDVMVQCTTHGHGDKSGLPIVELMQLKEEIKKTFPQYWNSPQQIEYLWSKCTESISQGCKRVRDKRKPKKQTTPSTSATSVSSVHGSLV